MRQARSETASGVISGPAVLALAVHGAALLVLGRAAVSRCGGAFTYALDDPYIHMAIARTLAERGSWGIEPGVFASASSSPLWTLLLAGSFAVAGVDERIPFVWNVLFGAITIVLAARWLASHGVRGAGATAVLLLLVLATPLPLLAFEGLEHSLQLALDLGFVALAARWLAEDDGAQPASGPLLVLAPLVASVRYEGAFLVATVCAFAALRTRWRAALLLAAAGAAPLVLFGIVSVSEGSFFLPNPVLLKSRSLGALPVRSDSAAFVAMALRGGNALLRAPHLLVPLLASLAVTALALRRGRSLWRPPVVASVIVTPVTLLHVQFAGMGWLLRYEAYLVALTLLVAAIGVREAAPRAEHDARQPIDRELRVARAGVLLVLAVTAAFPLLDRARTAFVAVPRAAANIHEQQVQMARFVATHWSGRPIAANDIGAIAFFAPESPLLDFAGLASIDIARLHLAQRFDRDAMERLAGEHGVSLVLIYDRWFERSGIPANWQRVARWTIRDRVAASHDTVSLYGVGPEAAADLARALAAFAPSLPASVRQRGAYAGAEPDDAADPAAGASGSTALSVPAP